MSESADLNTVIMNASTDAGLDMGVDDGAGDGSGDTSGDNTVAVGSGDSGSTGGTTQAEGAGESQPPVAEKPATQAEIDEFDAMLLEAGYKGLDGKIDWKRRLPLSKAKQLIAQHREKWEKGLTEKHTAALSEKEAALKEHADRLSMYDATGEIMETQPEKFLQMLQELSPEYKRLLSREVTAEQPNRQPVGDKPPAPDVELSDGSRTYSVEGLQALMDWQAAQVEKRINEKYEKQFGPLVNDYKTQQTIKQAIPKIQAQLQDAQENWPGFTENEVEILAALKADKTISLDGAYRKVVFPKMKAEKEKLSADRNKIREEVLAEINKQPRSTSTVQQAPAVVKSNDGPKDINDVIKAQLRKDGLL